jgi:putative phosphoesterase
VISGASSILVVSDSHGNIPALTAALAWARNAAPSGFDLCAAFFLGDGSQDLAPASAEAGLALPWHAVRGNGDLNFLVPDTLVVELGDTPRKAFLAHGNRFGVESGGQTIAAAAKAAGAEAALFGHTHIPYCGRTNGIFLLNPGSIGRSRTNAGPTFAVLNCPATGPLSARFFALVNRRGTITVEELEL